MLHNKTIRHANHTIVQLHKGIQTDLPAIIIFADRSPKDHLQEWTTITNWTTINGNENLPVLS